MSKEIFIYFIDNDKEKRRCFQSMMTNINAKSDDSKSKSTFKPGLNGLVMESQGYTTETLIKACTESQSTNSLWLLDIDMDEYDDQAEELVTHFYDQIDQVGHEKIEESEYKLYTVLKSYLSKKNIQIITISSLNDANRPDKELLNIQFPKRTDDYEGLKKIMKKIRDYCKDHFKGDKVSSLPMARDTITRMIRHAQAIDDNHIRPRDNNFYILNGIAAFLRMDGYEGLSQNVDVFRDKNDKSTYIERNFIGETLKDLSENKLPLSGIFVMAWSAYRLIHQEEEYGKFDHVFKNEISKFMKKWATENDKERIKTYHRCCRYDSFQGKQENELFLETVTHLYLCLCDLMESENIGEICSLHKVTLRPLSKEFNLIFKINGNFIAATNNILSNIRTFLRGTNNEIGGGSTSKALMNWQIGRQLNDKNNCKEGNYEGFDDTDCGSLGKMILSSTLINDKKLLTLTFRL